MGDKAITKKLLISILQWFTIIGNKDVLMKKIAVFGAVFFIILSQTFADEHSDNFKNIYFSWQLVGYKVEKQRTDFLNLNPVLNPFITFSISTRGKPRDGGRSCQDPPHGNRFGCFRRVPRKLREPYQHLWCNS